MSHAKFERYDAYKDSGVAWIGKVPELWKEVRIKDIAFLERGKFTHRPRNDPQMYDGIHPFIQTGDVARAIKYITNYKQTLSDKGTEVSKKFAKGSLLMTIAANIGDVAIVDFDTYFPDSVVGFKPNKISSDYLFYLLSATKDELNRVKVTNTQDNLNLERLNSLVKFIPPLLEQQTIVAYLDTKTLQIDRKIDLLCQKATQYGKLRQSLINETVTRGLDKTIEMKNSGVDWMGVVPGHWGRYRCKDLVDYYNYYPIGDGDHGSIKPEMYVDTGIPYIRVQNLSWNGEINLDDAAYITEDVHNLNKKSRLVIDDILIAKTGATVGKLGLITVDIKEANTTSSVGKITVNKKYFNPRFILYTFMAENFQKQIWITASQKSAQPGFNIDQFIFFTIACPKTKNEQAAIANYLDEKTAQIDRIVTTINTQIEKLKELRKTLINDVVTGKIKVVKEGQAA